MLDFSRIEHAALATEPYRWAFTDALFTSADGSELAATFPRDHFKTVKGHDGEKGYEYEARALISMGAEAASHVDDLSPAWQRLAEDLLSPSYRIAISKLAERDLASVPMEVNVFHYGPGSWLGPHVDLEDKIVSQIFYFNAAWRENDGGNLSILRSSSLEDVAADILPIIGNSAVIVRSKSSWHAVPRVNSGCPGSRRSMTVTFYRPGSISTMWPSGDDKPLHDYGEDEGRLKVDGGLPWLLRKIFRS